MPGEVLSTGDTLVMGEFYSRLYYIEKLIRHFLALQAWEGNLPANEKKFHRLQRA
jgi:hypothetical protein